MKILKDVHVKFLAQKLDDLIVSENAIVESIDGLGAKVVLNYLNGALSGYVDDNIKASFHEALDAVMESKYDEAVDEAFDILAIIIENANLKEGQRQILESFMSIIEAVLVGLLKK